MRNVRSESNVEPGRWITASIFVQNGASEGVKSARRELATLARIGEDRLTIATGDPVASKSDVVVATADLVAVPALRAGRSGAERERLAKNCTKRGRNDPEPKPARESRLSGPGAGKGRSGPARSAGQCNRTGCAARAEGR